MVGGIDSHEVCCDRTIFPFLKERVIGSLKMLKVCLFVCLHNPIRLQQNFIIKNSFYFTSKNIHSRVLEVEELESEVSFDKLIINRLLTNY